MNLALIISIIGAFLTIGLTINGFFLKGIMESQSKVELDIAKLMVKVESYSGRIDSLEHNFRKLEISHFECRSNGKNG